VAGWEKIRKKSKVGRGEVSPQQPNANKTKNKMTALVRKVYNML
jgi:hypothetical protein